MNFEVLLSSDRIRKQKTSQQEITSMLQLIDRDLSDASVETLSTDRRFTIAYEAALLLATIPLYFSGYETHGS